jgi:hypothetical protein
MCPFWLGVAEARGKEVAGGQLVEAEAGTALTKMRSRRWKLALSAAPQIPGGDLNPLSPLSARSPLLMRNRAKQFSYLHGHGWFRTSDLSRVNGKNEVRLVGPETPESLF